jgi:G:T-mismatch repair DNA endonuclease (very short patch repair protein)
MINKHRKRWTSEEVSILNKLYSYKKPKEIAKIIHRSYTAIRDKAEKLKLQSYKSWTEEEKQFLKDNYAYGSWKLLALKLNKVKPAIVAYARKLNLYKLTRPNLSWSEKDIQFLKDNYAVLDNKELSKTLNKSISALTTIAYKLKLYKKDGPKRNLNYQRWTSKELKILHRYCEKYSVHDFMEKINRSYTSIYHQLCRLNIYNPIENNFELKVHKLLEKLKIKFKIQKSLDNWRIDFFVAPNIIIEVNGTFWHCDERFFPHGPQYKCQAFCIEKDKRKKQYFLSKGYRYIVIWEYDFYNNITKIKQELKAVLNSNIQEYDSAKTVNIFS